MEGEKYITYNLGVEEFLANDKSKNYVVSGGIKEFIERIALAKYFAGVYGTSVKVNEKNEIWGIGKSLSNEEKVEAIKGILRDNGRREDDCRDVYYIGDGYSDYDSLKFVHIHGGKAIFVHQDTGMDYYYDYNQEVYERLRMSGMIDHNCLADYRQGTELYKILKRENREKM